MRWKRLLSLGLLMGLCAAIVALGGCAPAHTLPSYDSGWETLLIRPDPIAVQFEHNVGSSINSYSVVLECQDDSSLGTYGCIASTNIEASWYALTTTDMYAYVRGGSRPDGVRARLYELATDYHSGWETLLIRPDPIAVPLTHDLGGDPNDYLVDLECRDDSSLGTYGCTYAGTVHASWRDLTASEVEIYVIGGSMPDGVRLRIYTVPPVYDSGWHALGIRPDPIAVQFQHNLGGDPDAYIVGLDCWDDTSVGRYGCVAGTSVDASWYGLTDSDVWVYAVGGSRPDAVRVRIWRVSKAYLPLTLRQ